MNNISTLRRRADRAGMRLEKVPERSRQYWECGPYMLVDVRTSGVVERGLVDLEEVYRAIIRRA